MKRLLNALKIVLIVLLALFLTVIGYVGYVAIQYHRVIDELELEIENNPNLVYTNQSYTIITYNIGFGAYTPEFSFFMDSGEMLDGTKVSGQYAKAKNIDTVMLNTEGALAIVEELNPDFIFFQEVDIKATRSHQVNQYEIIKDTFSSYGSSFAVNFNSAYLIYPFHDPIGKTLSGIATLSKLQVESTTRYQFPVDESFLAKFFDLDRCFTITRISANNKELVLINIHMSAYDEGGFIREKQLGRLNEILEIEYKKGNYVIAGGDFNHDIAQSMMAFTSRQRVPNWVYALEENQLAEGYRFATSLNGPTCRSTDIPYEEGVNYTVVIDGFVVSSNIIVEDVTNIISGTNYTSFLYSDHNPVKLTFSLQP